MALTPTASTGTTNTTDPLASTAYDTSSFLDQMTLASVSASSLNVAATGANTTVDESAGLQNDSTDTVLGDANDGDDDDNDILAASLPSEFSTRMGELNAGSPINTALSGYNGAGSGSAAFTMTADSNAQNVDLFFAGADGQKLDGADSGLNTLDGTDIVLYTDSDNNNILLARAGGATGTIVFAAYIEEIGTPVTGGKIWITEYAPLSHPDTTSPDDSLNLLNKVFVAASQDLSFSLAGAPSGQNLFLMFTSASPATEVVDGITRIVGPSLIATGKDPVLDSSTTHISEGDTLNTSQAGRLPDGGAITTFGTNSQMITEQEGIRFTFVNGARAQYTIPNLDQNEADVEANCDFTSMFNTHSASFDVVQLQSGKSAQVRISAFLTDYETRTDFIDGYADDAPVSLTNIEVYTSRTGPAATGVSINVNDGTISGVKAGYHIVYTTSGSHNRVLIENGAATDASGNTHADFDIGGFTLLQSSVDLAEVGSTMRFEDDGPSVSVSAADEATGSLVVDETILTANDAADFYGDFSGSSSYGADGAGSTSRAWSVGIIDSDSDGVVDSGLVDVASGAHVMLYKEGAEVVGRAGSAAGDVVFKVTVDSAGVVTLDQQRAIKHPDTTDPDDSLSLATGLTTLTRSDTVTDKDGDQAQASAVLDIGPSLNFEDDGPSVSVSAADEATGSLLVDETILTANDTADFSSDFSGASSYGADGAGSANRAWSVGIIDSDSDGVVDSGLVDVTSGANVMLYKEGAEVVGRAGSAAGDVVFKVTVDSAGVVTLDQQRAIRHPDTTDPDDSLSLASGLVTLTRSDTVTDKDGDQARASAVLDIGPTMTFEDDGPTMTFGSIVGTGTTLAQMGKWTGQPGADVPANLDISFQGFALSIADSTTSSTFAEVSPSPNADGTFHYAGTMTADFDNNAGTADTTVRFTLSAETDGTYQFTLLDAMGTSTTTQSSADGSLDAGGPDPVRTLTIGTGADAEHVVFFGVVGDTLPDSIKAAIGSGATDLTEAEVQNGGFTFLGAANMNVSTSGIGIGNNNLNGYVSTEVSVTDESFVINPESLISEMKVFIDNSVQGYTPGGSPLEALYYRIFYENGTFSDQTQVLSGDLSPEKGNQTSFVVTAEEGKKIDAVQLIMGLGEIKIPVIEFITITEALASDVTLDFNALYKDADLDSASRDFSVTLNANDLGASVPDFTLSGATGEQDSFNVDLSSSKETVLISAGFETGSDKLVLLGDAGATVNINNSGADSVISVLETGGLQTTTVTIVGVDMTPSDLIMG